MVAKAVLYYSRAHASDHDEIQLSIPKVESIPLDERIA